jgi:hypothetical protein
LSLLLPLVEYSVSDPYSFDPDPDSGILIDLVSSGDVPEYFPILLCSAFNRLIKCQFCTGIFDYIEVLCVALQGDEYLNSGQPSLPQYDQEALAHYNEYYSRYVGTDFRIREPESSVVVHPDSNLSLLGGSV